MRLHLIAATLAVVVTPIAASATEPAAGRRVDNPNRVTCRVTRPVGSRLGGVRTCRTAAEWAAYQAEVRDVVHRVQSEGATFCTPNPNNPVSTC
jgi:hypothetical protein